MRSSLLTAVRTSACLLLAGCSTCEGEEVLATLEQEVMHVEFVSERRWSSGGRLPGYLTQQELRITRDGRRVDVWTPGCGEHYELAGDGTAGRFALRCAGDWQAVYPARGTAFFLCGDALGSDDAPRFDDVPPDFDAALDALGECAIGWNPIRQENLFDEAAALGRARAIDFLFETAAHHLYPWDREVHELPEEHRAALRERLRPRIVEDAHANPAACRALDLLPEGDPDAARVAADRLAEMHALDGAPPGVEFACRPLLARLLPLATRTSPERAAVSGCALLANGELIEQVGDFRRPRAGFDEAMAAMQGHPCDAVAEELSKLRCQPAVECEGEALCTPEDTRALLDAAGIDGPDAELSPARNVGLQLLAHAYAHDAVPADLTLAATRGAFSVARETPEVCADVDDAALIAEALCGGYHHLYRCATTVDEEAQIVRVSVRDRPGQAAPKTPR